MPPPMSGSEDALNAAQSNPRISTRPMAPIVVGLRRLNGLPPTLTLRVFIGFFSSVVSSALTRCTSPRSTA